MFYLPNDTWSPRYEGDFYTVKIQGYKNLSSGASELDTVPAQIDGKTDLPAYYYSVTTCREHEQDTVWRRYSHFCWLYNKLVESPPSQSETVIKLPPKTCFFTRQNDEFAKNRQEQLAEYIDDVLQRPGYADHPAVVTFLGLQNSD